MATWGGNSGGRRCYDDILLGRILDGEVGAAGEVVFVVIVK